MVSFQEVMHISIIIVITMMHKKCLFCQAEVFLPGYVNTGPTKEHKHVYMCLNLCFHCQSIICWQTKADILYIYFSDIFL